MDLHTICVEFFTRWFYNYQSVTDKDYADFNAALTTRNKNGTSQET